MPTKKKRKKRKNPSPPRDPNPGSRIHASLAARTGTATAADAMFLARFFSSFGAASVLDALARHTLPTNAMRRDATLGNPRFPEPKNYPGTRVMNRRLVMGVVTSGKITTPFRGTRRRRAPNEP